MRHAHTPSFGALSRYAKLLGFGEIHTKIDKDSGLHAIIAIHDTTLGPAIGGCRFHAYPNHAYAMKDALRLAYGMTLKAAACGLPHGGAKAVVIRPANPTETQRKAIFQAFGDFVQSLNGRYITAVDVGATVEDMTTIFERTSYVIGARGPGRVDEDPSPSTARGVFRAIEAAVKFQLHREDCKGLRIAIQGAGHVGARLAEFCVAAGMTVYISDINTALVNQLAASLGITVVAPNAIESVPCDIYAPCAMGGTISQHFAQHAQTKIVAGSANNQLSHHSISLLLQEKGILYLPDFLINSGGLINAAMTYTHQDLSLANKKIDTIYDVVMDILIRAKASGDTTTRIAESLAFERLRDAKK